MSANFQDLHATVEIGGPDQRNATALEAYCLHLHAIGHYGNRFMTGFISDASFSPILLELQVTHVQNAAEKHVAFPGAGRSHNGNNLRAIFPELLRSQKDITEFRERN